MGKADCDFQKIKNKGKDKDDDVASREFCAFLLRNSDKGKWGAGKIAFELEKVEDDDAM